MKKLLPFIVLIVLFAWGCGKSEKKEETVKKTTSTEETSAKAKVVARVNDKPIYENDLLGKSLQEAVDNEILYQEGLKKELDKKVEKTVEDYKKRLIVSYLQNEAMKNISKEVSDKEIEDYYNANKDKYTYLRLKAIIVGDKKLAEDIHKKALKGEDFEKIKSDYSKSGEQINVVDWSFNKLYNDQFRKLEVDSVSDVISQQNQFMVLKITEVKAIPLFQASESIKHIIFANRRANLLHEMAAKARQENNYKVEILKEEGK